MLASTIFLEGFWCCFFSIEDNEVMVPRDTHSLLGRDESSLRREESLPWRKKASVELRTVMRSIPNTRAAQ